MIHTQITKFNVHDVTLGKLTLKGTTLKELYVGKSDNNDQQIEAVSQHVNPLYGYCTNGLFAAVHEAYDKHIGLELDPCHFKLLILQGFSIHVNENAEKFRHLFVNHEGKKVIKIFRNDFVRGSDLNDWHGVFGEFVDKVNNDLNDKDLVGLVQSPLSTTTNISAAAFNISLMETMQQYFEYRMYTMCGIPFINLLGTVEDWTSLITLVDHIQKYELEWWTSQIKPILEKIVETVAAPDTVNKEFWGDIIKKSGGSGGPYYNGWICKFFPYLGAKEYRQNTFKKLTSVPTGISSVPVIWEYYGETLKMKFTAGFYGFTYVNDTLSPAISWVIHEDTTKPQLTAMEKAILNTYKYGRYYQNSKDAYGAAGVICDSCKKKLLGEHPCIHESKYDLCMECVIKIRDSDVK